MSDTVPVEAGQWRRGDLACVWAVLEPHPRRRGFWLCVDSIGPGFYVAALGRRELEAMPLVARDYFGGREHPGASYAAGIRAMTVSAGR